MRHAALAALLVLLAPLQAAALDVDELLGLVAMPLAVAAVSDAAGVPAGELSHLVATLNRADVPPTQFVQVVRYAPVALVVEEEQPTFVQYVDRQVDQGIVGSQLVTVIEERYRTYDLEPDFVVLEEPATTYVVRDDYVPPVVVTRVAQTAPAFGVDDPNDLLGLIAMPLAVAAVADFAGVPFSDLSNLVMSLNAARMPPVQVVEVLRYSPVVLVDDVNRPRFVQFVQTQVVQGVSGPRLVKVIEDRFRSFDVAPRFDLVEPRELVVVDDHAFFPPVVATRVASVRAHPHGGPPGQLKKELGLKTGAEVVHGANRRGERRDRVAAVRGERDEPVRVIVGRDDGRPREKERRVKPSRIETRGVERARVKPDRVERRRVERAREHPRAEQPRVERQRRVERQGVERQRSERVKPDRGERGRGSGADHGSGPGKGKGKGKG